MTKLLYCTFVPSSLRITSSPRSPRGTTIRKLYLYAALNGLTGSDQADRGLTSGAGAAAAKSEPAFTLIAAVLVACVCIVSWAKVTSVMAPV